MIAVLIVLASLSVLGPQAVGVRLRVLTVQQIKESITEVTGSDPSFLLRHTPRPDSKLHRGAQMDDTVGTRGLP
jgi:hypothetical protein